MLWTKHQPEGYDPAMEQKGLVIIERMGEIAVSALSVVLLTKDNTFASLIYFILSFLCMLLYELFWFRYFQHPCMQTFYGSMFHIPMPGALLPVLAFFLFGLYTRAYALMLADCILAFGHLGIHNAHRKDSGIPLF